MDTKLLTEDGWKAVALKFKVKDRDLQRALSVYEFIDEDEYEDRLKELANINRLAAALKKNKEVAALPAVVKYLADVVSATESEQREINKSKALAEKTEAMTRKKADAEAKKRDKEEDEGDEDGEKDEAEEDEEEEEGAYADHLMSGLRKLKGAKDLAFEFIVCDAKPHCALMVAKRITPKHKQELTTVTGGSKRFLHLGTCQFEDGRFAFNMEKPVTGLARKLQDSLKYFTGKKLPIKVGTESADEDDEGISEPVAAPKLPKPELAKAPAVWQGTRDILEKNINALKKAIQAQYANEQPDLIDEINDNMEKLDTIIEKLDRRLADSLTKANAAKDTAARKAELNNAKTILAEYINYVKSEPLIAHIDANPFGVKTNLKAILTGSLTHMAQAIG